MDDTDNKRGHFRNQCHKAVKEKYIQGNSATYICSRKTWNSPQAGNIHRNHGER